VYDEGFLMMKLDAGNVLLKPSQQRHLMSALRRSQKLGQRLGDFDLTISMQRQGRHYDMRAQVHHRVGDFGCHSRNLDLRVAMRRLIRRISSQVHAQCLQQRDQAAA
jgi:hypothetical protein